MANTATVDAWLCIDSDGDYGVGKDEASARESYENDVQPLADANGFRLVKVSVTVPLPEVIELEVETPAETEEEASVSAACRLPGGAMERAGGVYQTPPA